MGNIFSNNNQNRSELNADLEERLQKLEAVVENPSDIRIEELQKEIETLRAINADLEEKLQEKEEIGENKPKIKTKVSTEQIKKYVDNMLKDPDLNIKYLPDFVERQIYKNIFKMLLQTTDHILETTKIEFLGHTVNFDVTSD
jgi:hypothetical protein